MIQEALLTAKHHVNDETWNLEFKMIAPPLYKCEVVTHNRAQGEEKLKAALQIIKRVMRANGGKFSQKSEAYTIGANSNETDVAELMEQAARDRANEGSGDESGQEEEDQEDMGDLDMDEVQVEDEEDDEEEKKE